MFRRLIIILAFVSIVACSNKDEKNAPVSIAGKTYFFTVESGGAPFSPDGTFTIKFSDIDDQYYAASDVISLGNPTGTFTYKAMGNDAAITTTATGLPDAECIYTYDSVKSGAFECTMPTVPEAYQIGTFEEI